MTNENLERYQAEGFSLVEGWCSAQLFSTIELLDSASLNKVGGCMEIGVHHGKFFILLNQTIASQYRSYAVDVFSQQHLNVDYSGNGSLEKFQINLERYDAHAGKNVEIIVGDSTDSALNLVKRIGFGSLRFISIDGGHTVEHTISDLILSSHLINNEGVVILDDILNHHWLGVIEGAFRYLETFPTLVPFAIGHNKLYLSKLSFRETYFDLFASCALKTKLVKFIGHLVVAL